MKLFYTAFITTALLAGMQTFHANAAGTSAGSPYGKTVCEGRTWEYRMYDGSPWHGPVIEVWSGYHFGGTRTVDNREYAVFRDGDDKTIALMREEAGKVYLYAPDPDEEASVGYSLSIMDYTDLDNPERVSGDVLVYDFTLQPGDVYVCPCFDDYGNQDYAKLEKFEIRNTSTFEFQDERYNIQEFELLRDPLDTVFKVIEGAGNPSGMLPFPQIVNIVPGLNNIWYDLLRVTDADGAVLYENKELLAGVAVVPAVSEETTVIYDMLGRRVTEPVAGGLYVKDGRKVIWK